MDLARRILREIEDAPFDGSDVKVTLPDVSNNVLQYHLLLLSEAGLIDTTDVTTKDGPEYLPSRLTWQGHEFLDASRNETFWEKAKATALKKTGGLTFDILLAILKDLAKKAVLGLDDV